MSLQEPHTFVSLSAEREFTVQDAHVYNSHRRIATLSGISTLWGLRSPELLFHGNESVMLSIFNTRRTDSGPALLLIISSDREEPRCVCLFLSLSRSGVSDCSVTWVEAAWCFLAPLLTSHMIKVATKKKGLCIPIFYSSFGVTALSYCVFVTWVKAQAHFGRVLKFHQDIMSWSWSSVWCQLLQGDSVSHKPFLFTWYKPHKGVINTHTLCLSFMPTAVE